MGLTGVAALALVSGILSMVAGWWLMLGGSVGATFGAPTGNAVIVFGALQFALGAVELGVGYGLWRMKPRAWSAGFAVFGASIALDIGSVLFAGAEPVSVVLSLVVAAVAIWYLLQPQVRSRFAR
jgi:uncharacterized membrane protein (DUF2068 family)